VVELTRTEVGTLLDVIKELGTIAQQTPEAMRATQLVGVGLLILAESPVKEGGDR
jgi:hypothetical protein